MPKLTIREINRLEIIAKERDFNHTVFLSEKNGQLYLTDCNRTLELSLLHTA